MNKKMIGYEKNYPRSFQKDKMGKVNKTAKIYSAKKPGNKTKIKYKIACITFLMIFFVLVLPSILYSMVNYSSTQKYTSIIVQPGDNLWKIAQRHASPDTDLRKIIHEIKKVNRLNTASLMPGQELKIPQP